METLSPLCWANAVQSRNPGEFSTQQCFSMLLTWTGKGRGKGKGKAKGYNEEEVEGAEAEASPQIQMFCFLLASLQGVWLSSRLALLSFCVCLLHCCYDSLPQELQHGKLLRNGGL